MSVNILTCHRSEHPELADGIPPAGLLTPGETAAFHNLKTEKRRRDWLAGRYTAKHLVQHVFQEETGVHFSFADFTILNKENGAPFVSWLHESGHRPITLSISHAGDLAFCTSALDTDSYLGCDVEQLVFRSPLFIEDYFTAAEQALVSKTPVGTKTTIINAIWSGKEAALKGVELGLRVDTRAVTCLPQLGRERGWQPLKVTVDIRRIGRPVPPLAGRWRIQGPFVLTLVASAAVLTTEAIHELKIENGRKAQEYVGEKDR